ncbi:MAG: hypothetical protein KAJ08_03725 [Deltaproteobacteria bacterium]|nr:hypothetical protein [Deltaproteobacteria bacterium]
MSGSLSIEVPRNWKDIVGVPYAVAKDTANMIDSFKAGQTFRALSETPFTPMALRNAMRGFELYTEGQRTRSGRAISKTGEVTPRKISGAEAIKKGVFGLQPTKMSKGYAAYQATSKPLRVAAEKKKRAADRFMNAFNRDDYEAMRGVLGEITEWNAKALREGKYYMIIDIKGMVESRMKPGIKSIPKQHRANALRIANEWQ